MKNRHTKQASRRAKALERLYIRISNQQEKRSQKSIKKILDAQTNRIASKIRGFNRKQEMSEEEAERIANQIANSVAWSSENKLLISALIKEYGGMRAIAKTFIETNVNATINNEVQNILDDRFNKFVKAYTANQVKEINNTTKKRIRREVIKGLTGNKSYSEIAEAFISKSEKINKARAKTIARTETHNVIMRENFEGAKAFGFKKHQWVTSGDERVRSTHASINGQVREIGKKFSNGLLFPGDPNGPASEVVNCRCIVIVVVERRQAA